MKYNFFAKLKENFISPIENIKPYQDFFRSVDIVPTDINIQSISKDAFGDNMITTCITNKGLALNFFIGCFYIDSEYKDYLCGVYYIYNNKYFFLRNFGYDKNNQPTCIVDFYDTEKLEELKENLSTDKSYIEPKDFIKFNIVPNCTFNISLEKYLYETKEEDLIRMISEMSFDIKVRTRSNEGELPFEI